MIQTVDTAAANPGAFSADGLRDTALGGATATALRTVRPLWCQLILALLAACVPEGPPSERQSSSSTPEPPVSRSSTHRARPDPPLRERFRDDFERPSLGPDWQALSPVWGIKDGQLCGRGAKNRGVWLRKRIAANARIEFDARSDSPEGDIKVELWGDGRSGATSTSYTEATSYIAIFGGWKNSRHVLARINEHGDDALARIVKTGAQSLREGPVAQGQSYHFKFERRDGKKLSWWIDDVLMHEMVDPDPLQGAGHEHFGFNNWATPVCFDNLEVTPL